MAICKPSESYLAKLRERYCQARKQARGQILTEFIATTGYHRKHAIAVLRGSRGQPKSTTSRPRHRCRNYRTEDKRAVLALADLFLQIGSKRLRAAMDVELDHVRDFLKVSPACFKCLRQISPATMERFRRTVPRVAARPRGGTKPGTLLQSQIPIRTFADWDEKRPGFVEIDLVQQDGGNSSGFFACTLNVTDVATGWTVTRAVPNKAQVHMFAALKQMCAELPVPLLSIDSDNGGEFINAELARYCAQEHLTFTRGRVGRKNNNPYAEQKTGRSCGDWWAMDATRRQPRSTPSMRSVPFTVSLRV